MLTPEQRADRRNYWCSSDTARSLTGQYGGLAACVASKLYPMGDDNPSDLMALGDLTEGPMLDWWEAKHKGELIRNLMFGDSASRMAANLDGYHHDVGGNCVVEAKFVLHKQHEWGEPETDEVSEYAMYQVHHAMAVTLAVGAWVVAWFAGQGIREYYVPRDDELCESLVTYAKSIWAEYVEPKRMPEYEIEQVPHVLPALARRAREAQIVKVDPKLVKHWESAKAAATWTKAVSELCRARLIEALGDGDTAELPDGRVLTCKMQKRKAYTAKASEFPELRIKKGDSDGKRIGRDDVPALECG